MAHEFSFGDVSVPCQHICLTVPLRDFSIGHRLLLLRQRNPLVFGGESDFNKLSLETKIFWLIESVTICNQTYSNRIRFEKSPTRWMLWKFAKDSKKWKKRREKSQSEFTKNGAELSAWWALEIANFRNYLDSSRLITDFKLKREPFPFLPCGPMPDSKGRSLGGPYDATLIQFLIKSRLCNSEADALEYPFALAEAHYLTYLEREGAIQILNSDEIAFKESCNQRDLEAANKAGFKTVEEHVEFIKGNAVQEAKKKAAAENGLATEPPDELKGKP